MEALLEPYSLRFMREAALVAVVVGVVAPAVGVWVALRRLTYLGDAMSHGTLGGVGIAVLLGIDVVLGALGAGLLMAFGIGLLRRRPVIHGDAAIGISSVTLFALGVLLISGGGFGVEISHFLFGQLTTVSRTDLVLVTALGAVAVGVLAVCFGDLELTSLDPLHARQVGVRVGVVDAVLLGLVTLTVVLSLRSVGLLMSIAMLVVPANAARLLARTTIGMTAIAVALGVTAALAGLTASYHLATAPGATTALTAVGLLVVALLVTRLRAACRRRWPGDVAPPVTGAPRLLGPRLHPGPSPAPIGSPTGRQRVLDAAGQVENVRRRHGSRT
jgi:ABC-type Mn2+/Zn2+ transport system permease subunit